MRPSIARKFGLDRRQGIYRGGPFNLFVNDLKELMLNQEMVALTGSIGAGKTTILQEALRQLPKDVIVVWVRSLDKEHLRIGSIVSALIYDLSMESPRRDFEARSRQLNRILGTTVVTDKRKVVLVIENAHWMHWKTLVALKELREMSFAGVSPLFGIVLVAWHTIEEKLRNIKEISLRMTRIEVSERNGWMTFDERKRYLLHKYNTVMNETVAEQAAMLAFLPLEMDCLIQEKLEAAYYSGREKLTVDDFDVPLEEMKDVLGLSNQEIADIAGLHRSTVSRIVRGEYSNPKYEKAVREAMKKLALRKERREAV